MSTQHRPKYVAAHGPINNAQNSVVHHSLILALGNVLASRVELRPKENPKRLAEIESIMRDQATHIQELERNLEQMQDVEEER